MTKFPLILPSLVKKNETKNGGVSSANENKLISICLAPLQSVFETLESSQHGLSEKEAEKRLSEYGHNEIAQSEKLNFWEDMLDRLKNPLVIQLLVIATISALIGEMLSAAVVGAMILLSVGLSYVLDSRSNREVESLGKRVQSRTYVLRDGVETEIKMSEVVPGDIVLLQTGAIIPADVRVIWAKDFFVS